MNPDELLDAMRREYPCGEPRELGLGLRPAVLVVDFIEGFTNPESPMGGHWEEQIACTRRLVACARKFGVPAIYTTVELDPADLVNSLLYAKNGSEFC